MNVSFDPNDNFDKIGIVDCLYHLTKDFNAEVGKVAALDLWENEFEESNNEKSEMVLVELLQLKKLLQHYFQCGQLIF